MRNIQNESGVALILVLGLMIVIAVVAVIVSMLAILERGLTASERSQRTAFEGAQSAVEYIVGHLPDTTGEKGYVATPSIGFTVWNGDPSDTLPARVALARPGLASPSGMEYNVFAYRRYDVRGAGRMVNPSGTILANKGVRATVDVGPYVIPSATAE